MEEIRDKTQFTRVVEILLGRETYPEERELADEQLQKLYKNPIAWNICRDILSSSKEYSDSVIFTASKLLRVKAFYYFNEIPSSDYLELFSYIVSKESLFRFHKGHQAQAI